MGTFSVASQRGWNRLPTDLKLLHSADTFHHQQKTYVFKSAYGHRETDLFALWSARSLLVTGAVRMHQLLLLMFVWWGGEVRQCGLCVEQNSEVTALRTAHSRRLARLKSILTSYRLVKKQLQLHDEDLAWSALKLSAHTEFKKK